MHTLSDMGWRAPMAWRTPLAMKVLNWEQRELDVDEPLCEPTYESRSSAGLLAAHPDPDTPDGDSEDEEELVQCFRGGSGCCVEEGTGGAALADGRLATRVLAEMAASG